MAKLVEIKFDEKKLKKVRKMLREIPKSIPKVMSRAINKTAASGKVEIAREIAAAINIKASTIKANIRQQKATRNYWQSRLIVATMRIPLITFKARQIKTGASYAIKRGGNREKIKSAFIATMQSGHKGVFRRKGEDRLPIIELMGPSFGEAFEGTPGLVKKVTRSVYKKLQKNIDSQIAYILSKRKGAA